MFASNRSHCAAAKSRNGWPAGALLGLVNLCKPTFLLWPVALFAFAPRPGWPVLMAMLLVIAPWTYRNWRVIGGEFLPVAAE